MRVRPADSDSLRSWTEMRSLAASSTGQSPADGHVACALPTPAELLAAPACAAWLLYPEEAGPAIGLAEARIVPAGPGQPPEVFLELLFVASEAAREAGEHRLLEAADRWARVRGARTMVLTSNSDEEVLSSRFGSLGFSDPVRQITMSRAVTAQPAASAPAVEPGRPGFGAHAEDGLAHDVPNVEVGLSTGLRDLSGDARQGGGIARIVHWTVMLLGIGCIAMTDIWSADPIRGGFLVLVDVAFVLYVIVYYGVGRYRRSTRRPPSMNPFPSVAPSSQDSGSTDGTQ